MQELVVFGPPGTGKTTYLLSILEDMLKRYDAEEIAYVSFTRKGVQEGVERAKKKFPKNEFEYFRTIHSLCFRLLKMHKDDVMGKRDYKVLSDSLGLRFVGHYTEEFSTQDDRFIFAENLVRNNPVTGMDYIQALDLKKYAFVVKNYTRYKEKFGKIDYTDILEQYLERGESAPVKVAFIDEAQDLTELQWKVAAKLFRDVEYLFIAGDDDQAIFEWSGASVKTFLAHPGKKLTLEVSHRLPIDVYQYSRRITDAISLRKDKHVVPRDERGEVLMAQTLPPVEPDKPTLILARNNVVLTKAGEELKRNGIPFIVKGVPSVDKRILHAIQHFNAYKKGERNEVGGYATFFRNDFLSYERWQDAVNMNLSELSYYDSLYRQGYTEKQLMAPLVRLETIHSAKGEECDNVILYMDITKKVNDQFRRVPDSELRVLYVGVTRAKRKLTMVFSDSKYRYPSF